MKLAMVKLMVLAVGIAGWCVPAMVGHGRGADR